MATNIQSLSYIYDFAVKNRGISPGKISKEQFITRFENNPKYRAKIQSYLAQNTGLKTQEEFDAFTTMADPAESRESLLPSGIAPERDAGQPWEFSRGFNLAEHADRQARADRNVPLSLPETASPAQPRYDASPERLHRQALESAGKQPRAREYQPRQQWEASRKQGESLTPEKWMERFSQEYPAGWDEAQRIYGLYRTGAIDAGEAVSRYEQLDQSPDIRSVRSLLQEQHDSLYRKKLSETLGGAREEAARQLASHAKAHPTTPYPMPYAGYARQSDTETQDLTQALRNFDEAQKAIDAFQSNHDGTAALRKLGKGVSDKLFTPESITLGLSSLGDNLRVKRILDKADRQGIDSLSESEETLLNSAIIRQAVEAANASGAGYMYNIGAVAGESIPYMLQFILTGIPASAMTKGVTSSIVRYMGRYLQKKGVRRMGTSIAKGALWTADNLLVSAARTPFAPTLYADAVERQVGEFNPAVDPAGNVGYRGHQGDNAAEAYGKAFLNTLYENFGENSGAILDAVSGSLRKLPIVSQGYGRIASSRLGKLMRAGRDSGFGDFLRRAGYNGVFGETFEEYVSGALNAATVGDQSFEELFSKDNFINTFGGVGLTSILLGTANGALGAAATRRIRSDWDDAARMAERNFSPARLQQLRGIAAGTPQGISQSLAKNIARRQQLAWQIRLLSERQKEGETGLEGEIDELGTQLSALRQEYSFISAAAQYNAYIGGISARIEPVIERARAGIQAKSHPDGQVVRVSAGGRTGYLVGGTLGASPDAAGNAAILPTGDLCTVLFDGDSQPTPNVPAENVSVLSARPTAELLGEAAADIYSQAQGQEDLSQAYKAGEEVAIDGMRGKFSFSGMDGETALVTPLGDDGQPIADADGKPKVVLAPAGRLRPAGQDAERQPAVRPGSIVAFGGGRYAIDQVSGDHAIMHLLNPDGTPAADPSGNFVTAFAPLSELQDEASGTQPEGSPQQQQPQQSEEANAPQAVQQPGNADAPQDASALGRIPKDSQGNPLYGQADPDTAWDAIVEQTGGDEEMAQNVADGMAADKEASLRKIEKAKPKGGATVAEKIAAERERKQAVEAARQELAVWQRIAATATRRKAEADSQRRKAAEAEAAIQNAEQGRLRAEREEAERIEREAISGVPDFVDDTPQDARARGYRRVSGHKADRQEPVQALQGKEVAVRFSDDAIVGGRVAVIDAAQLQPSHIRGVRNPLHFLDEAQPKERNDSASILSARKIAENIRPEEIAGSTTAYTGAPAVNARGEVIQGNNRSAALREMWESHQGQAAQYKQYLIGHAQEFGLNAEDIEAMRQPVLVNMLDVDDAGAIALGQYVAQDTESGGTERIKPRNAVQRMGGDIRTFAMMLLRATDDDAAFAALVDANGHDVLSWMNRRGFITPTQYQSAFDSRGNLTAEAKNDLKGIMYQSIFTGGSTLLEEMFNALPAKAQRAILSTAYRDNASPAGQRLIGELQESIRAYHALAQDKRFAEAKDFKEARNAAEGWKRQYQADDVTGESYLPSDKFSNLALLLATMYKGDSQSMMQGTFNKIYDLIQGTQEPNLFEQPDNTPRTLAQAIKETFNLDYDGQQRSNLLAGDSRASQRGKHGSDADDATGERTPDRTEPSDRAAGASDDGRGRGAIQRNDERQGDLQPSEEVNAILSTTETDEYGKPFVLAKDGTTTFGLIDSETGLTEAPIRLSLGENTKGREGKNHGYGLLHIEAGHGDQIRNAGYASVEEFVEEIAKNYTDIREGATIGGNQTYILEVSDDHNNTLFIKLSKDRTYWNVNSAGIFRKKYSRRKPKVYAIPAVEDGINTDTPEVNSGQNDGVTAPAGNSPKTSDDKVTALPSNKQISEEESSAIEVVNELFDERGHLLDAYGLLSLGLSVEQQSKLRAIAAKRSKGWEFDGNGRNSIIRIGGLYGFELTKDEQREIMRLNALYNAGMISRAELNKRHTALGDQVAARIANEILTEGKGKKTSTQAAVEAASAEVNADPTPAQAEAGNYKKGHVTIGEFDITIENPAGSTRKGVDANGKQWSTTMSNAYGYIRGTEGVDGDHIDVFLHEKMDEWNGRKVFVVDQTNTDGTFDEHKVMLGFNDKDEAMSAYLANYDATWAQTHPGLRISEANIDDFNKWVQSSHRKTKPFADYSTVSKETDNEPTAIKGEGYSIAPKPYTNKQGKTLGTYLVTFDRDFPKEEMPALRAKAKEMKGWHDRETKGWMLRSADDAKAFAEEFAGRREDGIAGQATQPTVKKVSLEGVFGDLRAKGEAKLSDHAEPAEAAANPSGNRLVTDERYAELRERMRKKLGGQMNLGIDPEILAIGTEMAIYHLEKGARKFSEYAKAMIADLGDAIRPYLKAFYNGARSLPEVESSGMAADMTPYGEVQAFDTANFGKPSIDPIATARTVAKEAEAARQSETAKRSVMQAQEKEQGKKKSLPSQPKATQSLFDALFPDTGQEASGEGAKNNIGENENEVQLRTRAGTAERERGHEPRPNQPLGASQRNEDEFTLGRGMGGRSLGHTVPDAERGRGVSGLRQGERGISQPKNARNNHAERGVDYAPKGEKARIEANIAAIELAKRLLESGAAATPQEMEILRKYSGWGGLGAAFNEGSPGESNPIDKRLREVLTQEEYDAAVMSRNSAYYTPASVIDAMWDIAKALGFKGGNVLEGSAGIGNIIGLMPADISKRSNIHAVEIDDMTGGILSLLYPDAKVDVQGFEKTRIPNGSIDLAITNVPFVTGLHVMDESGDSDLSKKFRDIHDFCIAKNVRKLREGGIGIFITSSGTLDKSQKLRNWLVGDKGGNADVVGAFRMNNQTFGGTAATSDIIVVRKRVNGRKSANAIDVSTVSPARTAAYTDDKGKDKDLPMLINRYFIEHPENMGGEMFFGFEKGDTYRPTSMGLYPTRAADQAGRMAAWAKSLANKDWETEASAQTPEQSSHVNEPLGEGVKEGSMVLDGKGNLCVARMGRAVPLAINKNKIKGRAKEECFKDYAEIKDALAEVLKYQTEHDDDAGLQPLLDRLNRAYDTFVQRYGNLNKNNSLAWLRNDVDFPSIVALETYSEKGGKDGKKKKEYGKTDIFSRRVVEMESEPAPKNVKDGIIASLYKFGRIDMEYLATQLGMGKDAIKQEIISSGLGFEDPNTGQMEVSYEYLSGNVREKLRQAREANEASGGAYEANVKALESVLPLNIPAHLIEFSLGSSWIDPKLYERFVKERTGLDVKLTNAGGTWHMGEPWHTGTPKNKEMGVRSETLGALIPGHKLIEAAITNKTITVSRTYRDSDGSTHTETDPSATAACAAKVDEIRQDFKDWARERMQADPELSMRMEETYNEQFNNSVPKAIPDEFVPEHFGGAATTVGGKAFRLRPHQAKAVVRATTQPVLLAHEVGTGKTYTLITAAMEMRRLGTAHKPMIVVQNATVGQFVASAKALYPNAKVLTLEDADRNAEGRKAFYAKIKFNDWDMVVVPQSVFERIPDSIERQTQFIQDRIEDKMLVLEQMKDADPDGNSLIVRAAEREIANLENEIAQLANGGATGKKKEKDAKKAAIARQNAEVKARELLDRATDDVEDFDSMGIDAILVDEAHEYKHLGFATAMQRGVKGIDPSPSKKSQGVYLKAQAVLEKTGGKNVVFATGTPISNTAAEIWTFMRYLMPADVMKGYGIYYFDDFVRNFGNLQQMLEFTTSGKYKENNRFAGYVNLPELVRIWSTVADTVLTREAGGVNDKIPDMEGGKAQDIFLPQTRALRSIMKFVKRQLDDYDKMSGKEKKENSHIPLVMYGIAKAAAVDARLVQADAEDDPNSKTNEAVRQALRTLEETKGYKGTVAIFADNYQNKASGFNLYEDIRKKLVEAGVPEEQVVVMKPGMSVKRKLEIFDRVNAGDVRVVMGSTFTLGTGVNIQERLHTLIHLDAPNRPMDYTQRNGRILRQGNLHKDWGLPVRVLRFGVEDSLDVTAYQRLKTKGAIADSIMNGKQLMANSMENRSLEEEQDLFGDITAQLSGSEYAMLKNQVEKEVRKLAAKQKAWEADQTYIHNRKRQIAGQNKEAGRRIADNKAYLEKVEAATIGSITVGKRSYPSVEAMEGFFTEQNKKKAEMQEQVRKAGYSSRPAMSDITISIGGFDFRVHTEISRETKQGLQGVLSYSAPAKMTYSCPELGIDEMPVKGNIVKNAVAEIMEDVLTGNDFRMRIESAERSIERNNAELQSMAARDGVPFQFTEELAKAQEKLSEYEELMKKELEAKEAKYAEMDASVDAAANIELSEEEGEEPSASEPSATYGGSFASRYTTRDGKAVGYDSQNPEAYPDAQPQGDGRKADSPLSRRADLPDSESGEFCLVERVFTETGSFNFMGGERIGGADDVAFIFSALEDAAKEHSFVVLVKDGKPTVVELGMGTFNATMVDMPTFALAYIRIRPDQVYFVHNHPSGNLRCSPQDVQALKNVGELSDVPTFGVIINLKTGKYGTFSADGETAIGQKRIPENAAPLAIHTLDKQIFAPDYDPMEQPLVRSSEEAAAFLNSHRMGDRAKVSFLILSRGGRIVGNIHTPFTEISTDAKEKARYISERVIQFGGESAILYGDFDITSDRQSEYMELKRLMRQAGGTVLFDVVNVEGNHSRSAYDEGIVYEPGSGQEADRNPVLFRELPEETPQDDANERFNRELDRQIEGSLPQGHVYRLGTPSPALLSAGLPDLPIEMAASRLSDKAAEESHPFQLSEIKDLPRSIQSPMAVFRSATHLGSFVVMTEIEHRGRNFVVAIQANRRKGRIEVNSIRSVHYRSSNAHMAGWVTEGLLEYADKKRMVEWLSKQRYNSADVRKLFNHAANILQNFENPKIQQQIPEKNSKSNPLLRSLASQAERAMQESMPEAISREIERLAERMRLPVQIVRTIDEIPDSYARRYISGEIDGRRHHVPGYYDPATRRAYIIIPELLRAADPLAEAERTILHEAVAHLGMPALLGQDAYAELCDLTWKSLSPQECRRWAAYVLRKPIGALTPTDIARVSATPALRQEAADECIASIAEKGVPDPTIWQRVKAFFRRMMRRIGLYRLEPDDDDIRFLLAKARQQLARSNRQPALPKPAAIRYSHGGIDEFDLLNAFEDAAEEVAREFGTRMRGFPGSSKYVKGKTASGEAWQLRISNHPANFDNIAAHLDEEAGEEMPAYFTSIVVTDEFKPSRQRQEPLKAVQKKMDWQGTDISLHQAIYDVSAMPYADIDTEVRKFKEDLRLFMETGRSWFAPADGDDIRFRTDPEDALSALSQAADRGNGYARAVRQDAARAADANKKHNNLFPKDK